MAVKEASLTVECIYDLPDGERAELIDGQIYNMAPPNRKHQRLVHYFDKTIGNYIDGKGGNCEVYPAPFAVFLNSDEYTYVEPDISVICDSTKLDNKGCHGAPDWVIEIVSPSSRYMDYLVKLMQYKSSGVREYWIVDCDRDRVTVYCFDNNSMDEYNISDKIKVNIYDSLEIDLSEIVNDIRD